MKRWFRFLPLLAALLLAAPLSPARAQNDDAFALEGEEGGGGSGDPLYGYVATAFLAAGAIFVMCKSARR